MFEALMGGIHHSLCPYSPLELALLAPATYKYIFQALIRQGIFAYAGIMLTCFIVRPHDAGSRLYSNGASNYLKHGWP